MSATVDHIIPVAKNGHPSDITNLQLAHWTCNRQKSDKIFKQGHQTKQVIGNRNLPQSKDWINYNSNKIQEKAVATKKNTIIRVKKKLK